MRRLKRHAMHSANARLNAWLSPDDRLSADSHPGSPYDKNPQIVLREIGEVLAAALGFALFVNIALVTLHIS